MDFYWKLSPPQKTTYLAHREDDLSAYHWRRHKAILSSCWSNTRTWQSYLLPTSKKINIHCLLPTSKKINIHYLLPTTAVRNSPSEPATVRNSASVTTTVRDSSSAPATCTDSSTVANKMSASSRTYADAVTGQDTHSWWPQWVVGELITLTAVSCCLCTWLGDALFMF